MSDSYLLYQKYQKIGQTGNWIPVYPMEYSYNADGTMMPVVKTQNDPACGTGAIYQWVETDRYECVESDFSQDYLTLGILSAGTVEMNSTYTISASTDDGTTWFEVNSAFNVSVGDKVLLKGENSGYIEQLLSASTAYFDVYGNINSLVSGDSFTSVTESKQYTSLFRRANVVSAENLILPATTLTDSCYANMFYGCTRLTTAPELPATTLAQGCYLQMFYGCTSLTTAPALPATTLANYCYAAMFSGCTSLTTATALPATTLATSCYRAMFFGCTSLTTAPELLATTMATSAYTNMFQDCVNLTTAPELPATTLATDCYTYMFRGCLSLTTAPDLNVPTLVDSCYYGIFYDCRSLNYIKCLATNISANECTLFMTYNVGSTGTFVKNSSMSNWTTGINGIPSGWTVQNAS